MVGTGLDRAYPEVDSLFLPWVVEDSLRRVKHAASTVGEEVREAAMLGEGIVEERIGRQSVDRPDNVVVWEFQKLRSLCAAVLPNRPAAALENSQ